MRSFALHFIYLRLQVLSDPQWNHLHRFLHPGSKEKAGEALVVGRDLDLAWPGFVGIQAKDWESTGSRSILLRHDLVASILEVSTHTNQFGFVDLTELREQQPGLESS